MGSSQFKQENLVIYCLPAFVDLFSFARVMLLGGTHETPITLHTQRQ